MSLSEKGIFPSDKWKKTRFSSQGRVQRGPSLHKSWDSPQFWTLLSPGHLTCQPREAPAAWEQPDPHPRPDSLPMLSLACSVQSTLARKAPVHAGEFRGTQNRRIYTSSMTVPLPLPLPTGWDLNHPFPPQAGGCARILLPCSPLQGHPPSCPAAQVLL